MAAGFLHVVFTEALFMETVFAFLLLNAAKTLTNKSSQLVLEMIKVYHYASFAHRNGSLSMTIKKGNTKTDRHSCRMSLQAKLSG